MPRAIWKGAINFGLVHVPVALYPRPRTLASTSIGWTGVPWIRWDTSA